MIPAVDPAPIVRTETAVKDVGAAIGEGTHNVMLEKNRMQLLEEVQQFLDAAASEAITAQNIAALRAQN